MSTSEVPTQRSVRVAGRSWLNDFRIGLTGLTVLKTGARVPYSPAIIAEVLAWFQFFFAVLAARPEPGPRFRVAFFPDRARPWYMVWAAARLAGASIVANPLKADLVMQFEDAILSRHAPPVTSSGSVLLNFNCVDISKSEVARAFRDVFGYDLSVNPATYAGVMVEKGEGNGVHDGRIVEGPMAALPGKTYQRLVDNRTPDNACVEDLRTPMAAGKPVVVFRKQREVGRRFANANATVTMTPPETVFTVEEQAQLGAFAQRLGLDWGGLDVLRDRTEGRLYVVDANKTDMGPPTALPLGAKMRAARLLAQAFRTVYETRRKAMADG
jgi:hypothetical protein